MDLRKKCSTRLALQPVRICQCNGQSKEKRTDPTAIRSALNQSLVRIKRSVTHCFDFVMGGSPCQGFSVGESKAVRSLEVGGPAWAC